MFMGRNSQGVQKIKISSILYTLSIIVSVILLVWMVASYVNIIQHNLGSCNYTNWNLIVRMF